MTSSDGMSSRTPQQTRPATPNPLTCLRAIAIPRCIVCGKPTLFNCARCRDGPFYCNPTHFIQVCRHLSHDARFLNASPVVGLAETQQNVQWWTELHVGTSAEFRDESTVRSIRCCMGLDIQRVERYRPIRSSVYGYVGHIKIHVLQR